MVVSEKRINVNLNKYDTIDESLIASRDFLRLFGIKEDYVEAHVYTLDGRILYSDYDYKDYSIPGTLQGKEVTTTSELVFNPSKLVQYLGYYVGTFRVEYNILRKKVIDTNQKVFFIKEISPNRKEIRISSNSISSKDIQDGVVNFINEMQNSSYYKDFLLNFGDNKIVNAVNIALDTNTNPYSILVKLYQPLPNDFNLKDSFWFVEEMSTPIVYEVELFPEIIKVPDPFLKSANFDIELDSISNSSSDYENKESLLKVDSLSSYQQLQNTLNNKSVSINVDYSDYSNFIHFSSATNRLYNFIQKLEDIEYYNLNISKLNNIPSASLNTTGSAYTYQQKIDSVITNFDGYETYLYYESGSSCWPKSNTTKPYTLYPTTSSVALSWVGSLDYKSIYYGGQILSASFYDNENQDNLSGTIPEYIRIDDRNQKYELFVQMIGQHFDSIWLYIKSIIDLYKTSNSLKRGISKDLVYYILSSLGIKLYNSKSNYDLYQYYVGIQSNVNLNDTYDYLDNTNYGYYDYSYFGPSNDQNILLIRAVLEDTSGENVQKEILKRIYHNLSQLVKKKGTSDGLDDLVNLFGIPDTILSSQGFGGSDKTNNFIEYTYDRFSYALYTSGSQIVLPWDYLQASYISPINRYTPDTVELRFKPNKNTYNLTSSLIEVCSGSSNSRSLGVTISPNSTKGYPYSNVTLHISGSGGMSTASVSLPIYNLDYTGEMYWWNLMIKRNTQKSLNQINDAQTYSIFVSNKIDTRIGHQASASIYIPTGSSSYNYSWNKGYQTMYVGGSKYPDFGIFKSGSSFVGSLQELRYWAEPLSSASYFTHTLNPESIQGNASSSAYNKLAATFTLGNNLYVYPHYYVKTLASTHPNQKSNIFSTAGISQVATFNYFPDAKNYVTNTEQYVANSPNSVYANPVNQKIRIIDNYITGSVLSPFLRLEDDSLYNFTKDTHITDVSFSPQNEINKDIIAQYGNTFDIDQLIGDPRDSSKKEYPNLITLNSEYYSKFVSKYNLKDYIRVVQFYDNSLFKMIRDFAPSRDIINTGLTIKSPILERPKNKVTQTELVENYQYYETEITGSSIEADSIYISGLGDGRDFYTGEIFGAEIDVNRVFTTKNNNPYKLWR
jgi:hypothetical protein